MTTPIAAGPLEASVRSARFVTVQTVHSGFVGWWWTAKKLHDIGYQIKVNDTVRAAVSDAVWLYGVAENTGLCCQCEGVEIVGDDLNAVTQATSDVASVLAKFRGVVPLD